MLNVYAGFKVFSSQWCFYSVFWLSLAPSCCWWVLLLDSFGTDHFFVGYFFLGGGGGLLPVDIHNSSYALLSRGAILSLDCHRFWHFLAPSSFFSHVHIFSSLLFSHTISYLSNASNFFIPTYVKCLVRLQLFQAGQRAVLSSHLSKVLTPPLFSISSFFLL